MHASERQSTSSMGELVLLAFLLTTTSYNTAEAQVLAPSKASDLAASIVLYTSTPACSGTPGTTELAGTPQPPAGEVFILTSYQWSLDTTGFPANFPISVSLASVTATSGINTGDTIASSTTPNSGTGAVAKNETIPNGVVAIHPLAGRTHLCLVPATSGTKPTGFGWVQGYFAPNE